MVAGAVLGPGVGTLAAAGVGVAVAGLVLTPGRDSSRTAERACGGSEAVGLGEAVGVGVAGRGTPACAGGDAPG